MAKFIHSSDNIKHVITVAFYHFAGTLSAMKYRVRYQPRLINTINHAICSAVPGMMLGI